MYHRVANKWWGQLYVQERGPAAPTLSCCLWECFTHALPIGVHLSVGLPSLRAVLSGQGCGSGRARAGSLLTFAVSSAGDTVSVGELL